MFVIRQIGAGRVHIRGVTGHPTGEWVTRQAGAFMMTMGRAGARLRFLIRDRHATFAAGVDVVFGDADARILPGPPRAPPAKARAERWISTLRHECLNRLLIANQRRCDQSFTSTRLTTTSTAHIAASINDHPRRHLNPPAAANRSVPLSPQHHVRPARTRIPCRLTVAARSRTNQGSWAPIQGVPIPGAIEPTHMTADP